MYKFAAEKSIIKIIYLKHRLKMKKLSYLLGLLLVGSLIFTSCSDDDDTEPVDLSPSIVFTEGGEDVEVVVGDTVRFSVECASNSTSGKKLDKFRIYMIIDNIEYPTEVNLTDIDENELTLDITNPIDYAFEGRLYCEITDVDGESNSVSFNIISEEATTPLEGEEDLEWKRVGGTAGTGLDMFGLKWTSNVKEVMAVIQKDGADKLVQLAAEDWANITTKEDLMAAIEAAEDLGDYGYRGVSAEANGTYDDVLAVKFNNEYFIIHIAEGTVEVGTQGTTITITGMYNK